MKIHSILNNNVVIILDKNGNEKVVCGKGIAFKKSPGDFVYEKSINKIFVLEDKDMNSKFKELLMEIPYVHIQLADEIIELATKSLNIKINDSLYISLSDHIYTAVERFKEGITVPNALLWEIKRFYKNEFQIGVKAVKLIEKELGICLPEDEAGFIAIHIVNAQMNHSDIKQIMTITQIIQKISNLVRFYFTVEFDTDSVYYYRFITHLKFFAQRLTTHNTLHDNQEDDLLEVIKVKYKNSFGCVEKIAEFIKDTYQYVVSDEEKLYLTIHIERIIYKSKK